VSSDLEVYEAPTAPATLFGTDDPGEVVARATAAATPLAKVVRDQRLFVQIQQSKHVKVEGWCLLGSMLGVFPVTVWTRPLENGEGFEARVEARTRNGEIVGAAEAQCDRSEKTWKGRDAYALRSMAQTRATSKALRQPLGFVMQLAGFNATPAEEMPRGEVIEDGELVDTPFAPSAFEPPAGATYDDREAKDGGPTAAQLKLIYVLVGKAGKLGVPEETLRDQLELTHGTRHFSEVPKASASQLIDALKVTAGE
jgi:hypothetical protein